MRTWWLVIVLLTVSALALSADDYRIQRDDVLQITVVEDPTLSRETVVAQDGTINLPVVGTITVRGMTTGELAEKIRTALIEAQYLRDPHVSISLKVINRPRVAVLGMVQRPGTYEFKEGETVMHAISMAGSFDPDRARLQDAVLRRKRADGTEETIPLDLEKLFFKGDLSQNYRLQPDDVIFIPEDVVNRVYVLGKVVRPGLYPWKSSTTVLEAINRAGGQQEKGTLSRVYIIRPNPNAPDKPQRIEVNLLKLIDKGDTSQDIALQPGDTVYVPEVKKPDWNQIYSIVATIALTRNLIRDRAFYRY
ncbi:MAG: polysaccharide export protein [Firmicutes bacterium]|nr:polysaccharide export protein [Bacillota bacterium]